MYAKNLERLLSELMSGSDFSHGELGFRARFETPQSYGRLPSGRENRDRHLTSHHVASAILGLAAVIPKWAGHAATILEGLRPVGGPETAFGKAANFLDAVALLLDDSEHRRKLVRLSLSGAEGGINSNGFASLTFEEGGGRHCTHYVPHTAYSLFRPGAEDRFDGEERYAAASRELSLNRDLFDRIAREMELAKRSPKPPEGDGRVQ